MDRQELKNQIEEYINNPDEFDEDGINLPYITILDYAKLLAELGFNTLNKNGDVNLKYDGNYFQTDGWDSHFSWSIKRGKEKFTMYGSLFYGDFRLVKYNGPL